MHHQCEQIISLINKTKQQQKNKYLLNSIGSQAYPDFLRICPEIDAILAKQNWANALELQTARQTAEEFVGWVKLWAPTGIPLSATHHFIMKFLKDLEK
jgi:hypothetical protein